MTDFTSLICPCCGGSNTHQGEVRVFEREREDGPGAVTTVRGLAITTHPVRAEGLPGRRQTLEIDFSCEECDGAPDDKPVTFTVVLQQHKGATLAWCYWRAGAEVRERPLCLESGAPGWFPRRRKERTPCPRT